MQTEYTLREWRLLKSAVIEMIRTVDAATDDPRLAEHNSHNSELLKQYRELLSKMEN